jgi:hypothetical protein
VGVGGAEVWADCDCRSGRLHVEELGRDEVVSCDGRVSRGAEAAAEVAATVLAMSTGAWAASGLGRSWPEAVLMASSSVDLGSSQQRPCRMGVCVGAGRSAGEVGYRS